MKGEIFHRELTVTMADLMIMFSKVSITNLLMGFVVARVVVPESTVRGLPARILPETTRPGWRHGGKEVNQQPWPEIRPGVDSRAPAPD